MPEKLIIVEGPSGSGKSQFGFGLQKAVIREGRNLEIVRIMFSQKTDENEGLPIAARRELRGVNLNFQESSHFTIPQLEVITKKLIQCNTILFKSALDLRDESAHDILGLRSGISQVAIFHLAGLFAAERGEEGDEERVIWAKKAEEQAKKALLNDYYLSKIDGIIHLEKNVPFASPNGREGMSGLEDREGECISEVIDWVSTRRKIPVLRIDINNHLFGSSVGQEIAEARDFIKSL